MIVIEWAEMESFIMKYRTVILSSALFIGANAALAEDGRDALVTQYSGLVAPRASVAGSLLEGRSATAKPVFRAEKLQSDEPIAFGIAVQGRDH